MLRTEGPWSTEDEAANGFDAAVASDPRFKPTVYKEARGIYAARSPFEPEKTARIDRILMPSDDLIRADWRTGAIGVEIKAPDQKAGPAIAQCLDYCRAQFEILPGIFINLGFVFLFPMQPEHGTVASIMAQHRIGSCTLGHDGYLRFFRDITQVISVTDPTRNNIPRRKVGSR